MKYIKYLIILVLLEWGCGSSNRMQVTRLGFEPEEVQESIMYALPQTVLKITLHYQQSVFIPGPYAVYGEKFLGIKECITERQEEWTITGADITSFIETDPDHYYVINVLSGTLPAEPFEQLVRSGYISGGSIEVNEAFQVPREGRFIQKRNLYPDVTTESYTDQRVETMYKTIITDTSFVRVPVSRTVLERKTAEKKAEEAANFILELRLNRFELVSGYIEVFPAGEAMEATLKKMDELEEDYLSLFTGKQFTRSFSRDFYIVPGSDDKPAEVRLTRFSPLRGFYSSGGTEGIPVMVETIPAGKTKGLRNLMPRNPEEEKYNLIYYRIPDVADVCVKWNGETVHCQRMNIFQLGALTSVPVPESDKKPLR
ncbi:MAG: DUF4831 family protein [Bacteroidales bacterium]|nr:DUF4831 family protein [Bacteroidales bacterium]MBN2698483.1 DUF4831 family protein [Bacteroidales bacterium]